MANYANKAWEQYMDMLRSRGSTSKYLDDPLPSGWYYHGGEGFEGWSRVISLFDGSATFHVPDDFDLGNLQQIEPNWDGHTTEEKWERVMKLCGVYRYGKWEEI